MSKDDTVQTSDLLRPRHVGMPIRRTEDPRLLTGNGEYTADRKPDRALHVAFRRSEQPHAVIVRIDTTRAKAAAGVVAVFSAEDVAGDYKPVIPFSRMPNYYATPITALASKKVRYVGEAVVAVVAEDRYLAEDALELIDIEYAPLGAVTDPEFAASEQAPLLHEEAATNVLIAREFRKGDVRADLATAHVRVRDRFQMTRKAPLAMEPRSYSAEFESRRDSITLYTSSNIPGIVRDALAESLDLPGNRLRVVAPDVGGSFGSKGSLYPEEIFLCVAARKLRRSLKWTADRLEDISSSSQAFAEIIDAEMGFDENGIAIALEADVIGDVGAYSIYPWTCGLEPVQVVSFLPGPYKIRSYRGAVRGVATNKPPTGPYRGVGRPISTFVTERLMDMGAKALGIDPLEIRRRNLVRADEFPYRIASGIIWDKTAFVECLEAAAQAGDYDELRRQQSAARAEGRYFGIGLATYAELTGIGSRIAVAPGMPINTGSETAKIRIDSTGAITAAFGVASHGQGLETTLAQIIADDLGARFEDIRVVQGDSDGVPMSTGTYASRSAVLGGGAAKHASQILREKIKKVASHLLEAAAEDIDVSGGRATVTGTDRAVTFKQIAKAVYSDMKTLPVEARQELEASYTYDPINGTTACATHLAAVEVDPTTCFCEDTQICRRGRLRSHHQSDDRGRAGSRRRRAGHWCGALRRDDLRRRRPARQRQPCRLRHTVRCRNSPNRRRPYRKRVRGRRRLPRNGRGRHDRRAGRDRERDFRRAVGARHRCFDSTNDSGADFQAAGESAHSERKQEMNNLAGRVALVTGGGRDVGAGISLALAEAGATVAVNYNSSKDEAEAVVAEIEKAGGKAKAYQARHRRSRRCQKHGGERQGRFRGLDILVNNAGLVLRKRFNDTTPEDWHRQIDTCLYGAIHCCHAAAPLLEASGRGRIISIMGDSSRVGESGLAIAAAARAGNIALMKSLAREMGKTGTTANSIALGLIESAHDKSWVEANRDKLVKAYPIRRLGQPSDVAPMVALLASDAGSWITGQVISISGGFSMV